MTKKTSKIVVVYSGGLDSTVLLHQLIREGNEVKAISIDYGQRHRRELSMAAKQAALAQIEHRVADLGTLRDLFSENALTSDTVEVPSGHYTEESMKATVVPNRNMILLAVAAGWAMSLKFDAVAYAAHSGDHAIYPDCRPEFGDAMGAVIKLADWHPVELSRPFVSMDKTGIVRLGAELGVRFDLTWSCYRGGAVHCGTCGTCVERKEAFTLAQVSDPTVYE